MPPAHARVAAQGTRNGRALARAGAVAWTTGLGPTAIYQRMVPPAHSFGSVRSRSGSAPLEPPAYARVAAQGTRDGRALARARAVAWPTGLGLIARLPSSERATDTTYQRMVPPARSFGSVLQCGPVVAVRLSCLQRTLASQLKARKMGVRLHALGPWLSCRGLANGPRAHRLPVALSAVASSCSASRRFGARALSCRAASHWRCSSRAYSARSHCNGSHARSACDLSRVAGLS